MNKYLLRVFIAAGLIAATSFCVFAQGANPSHAKRHHHHHGHHHRHHHHRR